MHILNCSIEPTTLSGKVNKTLSLQNQNIRKITDFLCHECVLHGIRLVTHIRMVAKSACSFVMFLRLSGRLSKSNSTFTHTAEFREFLYCEIQEFLSRNSNFVKSRTKISRMLHEDLSTLNCCWRHICPLKHFYSTFNIFILLKVTCSLYAD